MLVAAASNEVWTIDIKGWWRTQDDVRFEPLTVRDEYSRYILEARCLADGRIQAVQACLQQLFERYGKPKARHCSRIEYLRIVVLIQLTNRCTQSTPEARMGLRNAEGAFTALGAPSPSSAVGNRGSADT